MLLLAFSLSLCNGGGDPGNEFDPDDGEFRVITRESQQTPGITPLPTTPAVTRTSVTSSSATPRPSTPTSTRTVGDTATPEPSAPAATITNRQLRPTLEESIGSVSYDPPERMSRDETYRVVVQIAPPGRAVGKLPPASGAVTVEDIPTTLRMRVDLRGRGFDIENLSADEQIVDGGEPTVWRFDVTPTRKGTLYLSVSIDALLDTPDARTGALSPPPFERKISVDVGLTTSVLEFANSAGQWTASSVIGTAGLVLAFLSYQHQRRTKEPAPAAEASPTKSPEPKATQPKGQKRGRRRVALAGWQAVGNTQATHPLEANICRT